MDQDELIPCLRRDIECDESGDEDKREYRLIDQRLGRRIKLDGRGRDIALLLDRPQVAADLLKRIGTVTGKPITIEALDRVIGSFAGLGLLETEDVASSFESSDRIDALRDSDIDEVPLVVPSELRFTCMRCGSCCVGVNIGPVSQEIAERLTESADKLGLDDHDGLFFKMVPDGEDKEISVCRSRNGACVFLGPDGLCRVHGKLGPSAKPHICRLFPFKFIMGPDGIHVGLQMECRRLLDTTRGQPLIEQEEQLRELAGLLPKIPKVRMFVSVDGRLTIPYDEYTRIEDSIVAAVESADGGGFTLLAAMLDVLADFCASSGWPFPSAPAVQDELRIEFYSFLQELGEALVKLGQSHDEQGSRIRFHTGNLDTVTESLSDVPLHVACVFEDDGGDGDRLAGIATVNFWRSKEEALAPHDLVTAASRHAFAWFLTRSLAVSRARRSHRLSPTGNDLLDAWITIHMLLRNSRIQDVMNGLDEKITRLFGYFLKDLVDARFRIEQTSSQIDFHVF